MNELPAITLLQQAHAVPHTGEELEVMGKYAASKYIKGECPTLTDAVVETVKHAGLSPEQVRRVVEFTNTAAYLTEFNKEGAEHRYVEFQGGPADPAEVLRDLNDGGGGTVFDRGNADYMLMPKAASVTSYAAMAKLAAAPMDMAQAQQMLQPPPPTLGDESNALAAGGSVGLQGQGGVGEEQEDPDLEGYLASGAQGQGAYDPLEDHMKLMQQHIKLMQQRESGGAPKVASLDFEPGETALVSSLVREDRPYSYADPLQDSVELYDKLAGAADHVTGEVLRLEVDLNSYLEDTYQQVKQAALDGVSLGQILAAWQEVVPDAIYVKTAFAHIGPRLAKEEVFRGLDAVGASLQKTAHAGFVNTDHPVVGSMAAFCLTLSELAEKRAAQEELIECRDELHSFLQKAAAGGVVGKVKDVARAASAPAGEGAEWLTKQLVGEGAAASAAKKLVGGSVKYAPEAAAGTAGVLGYQEARDRYRASPIRRAVRSRKPGTPEYQERMYRLSGGM